ncbi:hypothetical protein B0T18DRAFT_415619 [Schizothecium vesticola]|uniref:Uncharacterized protein n=1 Tax=Schizothecium vesticola TaxID=314040 RepID=A0AA40EQL3_9PEZI|nr:hypothetical protein B0T18DRAFT_415619 [Schizothecium vesticola]
MINTKALGSLKSIFPPIHVPSDVDSKAAKKILTTLTSSFRTHLNAEHGAASQGRVPHPLPPMPPHLNAKHLPPLPTRHRDQPTDRHMRAILTNPLFGHSESKPASKDAKAVAHEEIFALAVSKGLMTVTRAHGFLLRVLQDLRQASTLSLEDGMRESGAGLLVVQWLRASGEERQLSFLQQSRFTYDLLPFMVAEKLDELAWSWFQRLAAGEGPKGAAATLLNALVMAKSDAIELDAAYASILKGDTVLRKEADSVADLVFPWSRLARITTFYPHLHKAPAADLFDSFVDVGNSLSKPYIQSYQAHLALHHPTKPSPNLAVTFLSDSHIWQKVLPRRLATWRSDPSIKSLSVPGLVQQLYLLSLDTAKHLGEIGEAQEAKRIMERVAIYLTNGGLPLNLATMERGVVARLDAA